MKHFVKQLVLLLAAACAAIAFQAAPTTEAARWKQQAANVTIERDDWGIAHVYGKTDADAVFGMMYTQAEDDFNRVETNYLNAMGRLAEAEGLNDYLAKHPEVKPRVIQHFEPWMALSFTEGSIGGDIERVNLNQLQAFYGKDGGRQAFYQAPEAAPVEPGGSNGMAIAPSNTAGRHALLLINPHTSFFFRSELQMVSEQGLNAYGAVTWGQFFIYQGFNERTGWMHTSSGVDAVDEYLET